MGTSNQTLIGQRIRQVRTRINITQSQLAQKVGIDRTHMNKIEKGKHTPGLDTIKTLAFELGVTIEELTTDTNLSMSARPDELLGMWEDFSDVISETLNVPMFLTTPSGYIIKANKEFVKVLGYYNHEPEMAFVNVNDWTHTSTTPTKGKIDSRIVGRNGIQHRAYIKFKPLRGDSVKDMVVGIIIPKAQVMN